MRLIFLYGQIDTTMHSAAETSAAIVRELKLQSSSHLANPQLNGTNPAP